MKRNNIMLIIQTILMYLAHLPLYVGLILVRMPSNENLDKTIAILFLIGFILTIVILPIAIVNLIMALAGAFNKKDNPCKTTMIVKLVLIPWYIMNFLFFVELIFSYCYFSYHFIVLTSQKYTPQKYNFFNTIR